MHPLGISKATQVVWKSTRIILNYVSPSIEVGNPLLYFSSLISVTSVLCLCVLSVYHAGGQTRWRNAGLLLARRLRRWANISPVLGYRVVFNATLNVGQRHRRRANINPAFVQSIMLVLQPAWSRTTEHGWMDTSQHRRCWPNI